MLPKNPTATDNPTKEAIFKAAESLFIKRGFADTPTSLIARKANVTKSLIHHYFGSKEQLWREIKRRRLYQYFEMQKNQLALAEPDAQCLEDAIVNFFEFLKSDPGLVRLFGWYLIEDLGEPDEEEQELGAMGARMLAEAQKEGHIRLDVDPKYVIIAFCCLVVHWHQAKDHYLSWFGPQSSSGSVDKEYLENILKIFFEGVLPR
ncbi:MAG: TetR/AcrR family transcriptional regulator [Deltaproteobacteria bacterium]